MDFPLASNTLLVFSIQPSKYADCYHNQAASPDRLRVERLSTLPAQKPLTGTIQHAALTAADSALQQAIPPPSPTYLDLATQHWDGKPPK